MTNDKPSAGELAIELAGILESHLNRWERRAYRTPLDHYEGMNLSERDTKIVIAALRSSPKSDSHRKPKP
jgi:hypothetical protein